MESSSCTPLHKVVQLPACPFPTDPRSAGAALASTRDWEGWVWAFHRQSFNKGHRREAHTRQGPLSSSGQLPLCGSHTQVLGTSPFKQTGVQPWQASQEGNASRISVRLAQPPQGPSGSPNISSEACQWCGPGRPGWASGRTCDSGLVRPRQDVSTIHWATRNLTLLFIGSASAGPA